jgi:tetratricopeptide (TPR) repeat protein
MTIFDQTNAVTLATNLLDNKDQQSIEFLAQSFDGYPMLIVQGTQLLNQVKGLDKAEYKKKIYQSSDKIKLNIELATNQLTPSASQLLHKIALINNHAFSKQILSIITDSKDTIDDDIYQLSKFVLISNIDSDENNPVFEMHDIVAQKIRESNEDTKNKLYLEDIVVKITKSLPTTMHTGHIFHSGKTINENLKVITSYQQRYDISIYKLLPLNYTLSVYYNNILEYYESEKLFNWFNELDKKDQFNISLMNNEIRHFYAGYFAVNGKYYKNRLADCSKALECYLRSSQVLESVVDYQAMKCNIRALISDVNISLGKIDEAQKGIDEMQEMFDSRTIDIKAIAVLLRVKAKLYYYIANITEALKENDKAIIAIAKMGIKLDDLFFTPTYILRAEILNSLGWYQEAYTQAEQLYKMHKLVKKEDSIIFGQIFTQMARAELGLGKINQAFDHINKAVAIFLADERRKPKDVYHSEDLVLSASYVVLGDILAQQDKLVQAIDSYRDAELIYFYLYKKNIGNVAHVSELYLKGAKASCRAKDIYHYQCFGKAQIEKFGKGHPNSITMFNYCKKYDMDLWQEKN